MNKLNPSLLIAALLLSATAAPGAPTREAVEGGLSTISFETRLAAQKTDNGNVARDVELQVM